MTKIRLQGPENFGGFSHAGQNYTPDDEGVIEVPAHLPTEVLSAHGLKTAPAKVVKPLAKNTGDEIPVDAELLKAAEEAEALGQANDEQKALLADVKAKAEKKLEKGGKASGGKAGAK